MKILDRVYIFRVEYYNPHPPNLGNLTFYAAGHTIEEVIRELCIHQNINPSLVRERQVIAKLDCMTTVLLDKLIGLGMDDYTKRNKILKQNYDEYIENNPQKPSNVSKVINNSSIFTVLD
jgi:hypothetical protein